MHVGTEGLWLCVSLLLFVPTNIEFWCLIPLFFRLVWVFLFLVADMLLSPKVSLVISQEFLVLVIVFWFSFWKAFVKIRTICRHHLNWSNLDNDMFWRPWESIVDLYCSLSTHGLIGTYFVSNQRRSKGWRSWLWSSHDNLYQWSLLFQRTWLVLPTYCNGSTFTKFYVSRCGWLSLVAL